MSDSSGSVVPTGNAAQRCRLQFLDPEEFQGLVQSTSGRGRYTGYSANGADPRGVTDATDQVSVAWYSDH